MAKQSKPMATISLLFTGDICERQDEIAFSVELVNSMASYRPLASNGGEEILEQTPVGTGTGFVDRTLYAVHRTEDEPISTASIIAIFEDDLSPSPTPVY